STETGHGWTHQNEIGAHGIYAVENRVLRAGADGEHRHHRADADDDAEQGEDGAEDISLQRAHSHLHRFRNIGDAGGTAVKRLAEAERSLRIGYGPLYSVGKNLPVADFDQ